MAGAELLAARLLLLRLLGARGRHQTAATLVRVELDGRLVLHLRGRLVVGELVLACRCLLLLLVVLLLWLVLLLMLLVRLVHLVASIGARLAVGARLVVGDHLLERRVVCAG